MWLDRRTGYPPWSRHRLRPSRLHQFRLPGCTESPLRRTVLSPHPPMSWTPLPPPWWSPSPHYGFSFCFLIFLLVFSWDSQCSSIPQVTCNWCIVDPTYVKDSTLFYRSTGDLIRSRIPLQDRWCDQGLSCSSSDHLLLSPDSIFAWSSAVLHCQYFHKVFCFLLLDWNFPPTSCMVSDTPFRWGPQCAVFAQFSSPAIFDRPIVDKW